MALYLGKTKISSITIPEKLITIDSALSTESENPVQNKVITNYIIPALDNFIPSHTTYTVEADGSGDFATIHDAIDFLQDKWSNGTVYIHLGTGTFNISSTVDINFINMSLGLEIYGNGKDNTIINLTTNGFFAFYARAVSSTFGMAFSNFKIVGGGSDYYGIHVCDGYAYIQNCEFNNLAYGILSERLARVYIETATFKNIDIAIQASFADISIQGTLYFDVIGNCYNVFRGGTIRGRSFSASYGGGISSKFNTGQQLGVANERGWITGAGF